jgi:acetylornithine deacetylase/succinyl-diaminopimelate desuccinylase-like protein
MTTPHLITCVLDLLSRGDADPDRERTINGASISAIMDRLYFGDFKIFEQLSTGPGGDRINLIGRKGPSDGAPVWLVAQTGLGAPPLPARWPELDGAPVTPRRLQGPDRLSAFGAQSGRVDLLAKILAASRLPTASLRRPIHIAGISGEEGLGSGAPLLFPDGTAGLVGTALVGGPTVCRAWSRHPGCVLLQLRVTRRTRHRRMPPHGGFWHLRHEGTSAHVNLGGPLGPDALEVALAALDALRSRGDVRVLAFEAGETGNRRPARASMMVATQDPDAPGPALIGPHLTVAPVPDGAAVPLPIDALLEGWLAARRAGVAAITATAGLARPVAGRDSQLTGADAVTTGRVASDRDGVTGVIAIWTGAEVDVDALCDRFAEAAEAALDRDEELDVELEVLSSRPAWEAPARGPLRALATEALRHAGLTPDFEPGLASTDAGLFASLGLETLVFGPTGPLEALYQDREAVAVAQLEAATRFYEAALAALCLAP